MATLTRQQLGGAFAVLFVGFVFYMAGTSGKGPAPAPAAATAAPQAIAQPAQPPKPRPGYSLMDGGRYGYEGAPGVPLTLLAYNGRRPGGHQLMDLGAGNLQTDGPQFVIAYEWKPGDEFVVARTFVRGKMTEKQFVRVVPDAIVAAAMRDAEAGFLERYVHRPNGAKGGGVHVFCDEAQGCKTEGARLP